MRDKFFLPLSPRLFNFFLPPEALEVFKSLTIKPFEFHEFEEISAKHLQLKLVIYYTSMYSYYFPL